MRTGRLAAIVLVLGLANPGLAQMMGEPMMSDRMHGGLGMSMGMGMRRMGMDELRVVCATDLGALGLPAEAVKVLEDQRIELQKTVIRKKADLEILQLELRRLLADKGFNLAEAEKKAKAMAEIETELESAHLKFLHEMASKLTDEQWQELQQKKKEMMMPMMGGEEGGMMMQRGELGGAAGHHPGSRKEAEEFFKKK
jgi:hypothetical protein